MVLPKGGRGLARGLLVAGFQPAGWSPPPPHHFPKQTSGLDTGAGQGGKAESSFEDLGPTLLVRTKGTENFVACVKALNAPLVAPLDRSTNNTTM